MPLIDSVSSNRHSKKRPPQISIQGHRKKTRGEHMHSESTSSQIRSESTGAGFTIFPRLSSGMKTHRRPVRLIQPVRLFTRNGRGARMRMRQANGNDICWRAAFWKRGRRDSYSRYPSKRRWKAMIAYMLPEDAYLFPVIQQ